MTRQYKKKKKSSEKDRITIDALVYYVPIFQKGDKAEEKLLSGTLTEFDENKCVNLSKMKELAVKKIADLSGPLITSELTKIISASHLKGRDDLFDILYYAGLDGMKKGLRRFDISKIDKSSTNYLFQWIMTYAKKELAVIESPFGIPISRFQKYKKISAVRKRLSDILGHYATNEEVYEFFQSGGADIKTMNGRVKKSSQSKSNLKISLSLIQEQEEFEKNMMAVDLLDTISDYTSDIKTAKPEELIFEETVFGVFLDTYNMTPEAKVVIKSVLNAMMNKQEMELLDSLTRKQYTDTVNKWKNLIKDSDGVFYKFLKDNKNAEFQQFDVKKTIEKIENSHFSVDKTSYAPLFES